MVGSVAPLPCPRRVRAHGPGGPTAPVGSESPSKRRPRCLSASWESGPGGRLRDKASVVGRGRVCLRSGPRSCESRSQLSGSFRRERGSGVGASCRARHKWEGCIVKKNLSIWPFLPIYLISMHWLVIKHGFVKSVYKKWEGG